MKSKQIKFNKQYWQKIFNITVHWIFRRMAPDTLEFYNDKLDDWLYIIDQYMNFEKELYIDYFNKIKEVPFIDYQNLCNKYIHQAKIDNNKVAIEFFFIVYKDYPQDIPDFVEFFKPATKEEIEQARKNFGYIKETSWSGEILEHSHTFSDSAQVLEYRGLRLIIDNEWGDVWIKDEQDKIHNFQLIWDWNFPIDQYIVYHII